ncbi:MAG: DUF3012 domain-containing protein [Methylococcaceae bacterium]|nr:DUF3012 domain-containing protein [Methylococcaceae bacterium]
MHRINRSGFLALSLLAATGCAPEVGSEAWCEQMEQKPKADWSLNEAGEFAKSCIFRKSEGND